MHLRTEGKESREEGKPNLGDDSRIMAMSVQQEPCHVEDGKLEGVGWSGRTGRSDFEATVLGNYGCKNGYTL